MPFPKYDIRMQNKKKAEILTFDASADHFYPIFNTRAVLPRNCFRELLDDLTT